MSNDSHKEQRKKLCEKFHQKVNFFILKEQADKVDYLEVALEGSFIDLSRMIVYISMYFLLTSFNLLLFA
jgi:hypothetical protein